MPEEHTDPDNFFKNMLTLQGEAMRQLIMPFLSMTPGSTADDGPNAASQHGSSAESSGKADGAEQAEPAQWLETITRLQALWLEFQQTLLAEGTKAKPFADTQRWFTYLQSFWQGLPFADTAMQERLWQESTELWQAVLGLYDIGAKEGEAGEGTVQLPRKDRRFTNPLWRENPAFAIIHQTYLILAEQIEGAAGTLGGHLPEDKREQMRFALRCLADALSPANFPSTNPLVLQRTLETNGQNLVKGMEHLLADLKRGQLSHTDADAFVVGRDVAITPGKVVHETPLFQLIQYTPTTDSVHETPLVICPPWINRFYILDLNPQKSFVRWAVEQGLSVFILSWKSADETMADVAWDDYIRAQIDAVEVVCQRLGVPHVHAIGYCAAGTTLAATLAILARRGQDAMIRSATFFTAQVDFEKAGELKVFCDDATLAMADQLMARGYLDGRYMAATFNALRSQDLIWNYVISNYLLGEDYPAFDLLFWNGDTTNLPARWHRDYTRDLYRDNKLIIPDALSADGTPIDLSRVETPCYIQAGREDHIAPPESVFRMTRHFTGPQRFVLAGSGHIAGVVNPPSSGKYQYWTNERPVCDLDEFVAGATEHPGSWWTDWISWIQDHADPMVPATGPRAPGGPGDKVIEDAPGRYVLMR